MYMMDVSLNVEENNVLQLSFLQVSEISVTLIRFISSFERKSLHFNMSFPITRSPYYLPNASLLPPSAVLCCQTF